MPTKQESFDALIGRLNTATNDIAADYQKLLDEAVAAKAQISDLQTRLGVAEANAISDESIAAAETNIATLEALGASVENPVPEPTV